ncbi:MAG TPA: ABC transporter ATP-binding protein [Burkholderiales bacterium]|nr:ABC transporter ATP-binding protein [Burkholderiales bacterium]
MTSEYLVELEDVSFSYGERPILSGITLRIPRGKVVAIMGASGSGKTTILRMIGGAIRPTRGRIKVFGQSLKGMRTRELYELRRKMGMLFQFGALFTDLTAFENVAFPIRERTQLPEEIVRDLVLMKLQAVGLRGAAHMRPQQLSGGMARRVALARTIALDPELIMYDEPFTGLDPISLAVTGKLIRELNDALGATSIIVTHDVHESLQIVDHLYFIAEGRVIASGTPDEVRHSDMPFVRQFVHAEIDGPVPFHQPTRRDYRSDLLNRV